MPWLELSIMSQRCEFINLATTGEVPIRELCRRFGISPKTAYKWLSRYREEGFHGLQDRSRQPHRSPWRTSLEIEKAVLVERDTHPVWGGRKIRARLQMKAFPVVPSSSTITAILKRHGRIDPQASAQHKPFKLFEHDEPNALWQMDFKGHFPTRQGRCHPLTVLDDHSRFSLGLRACKNEQGETVQGHLTQIFERYGLPKRILMDNGPPWCGGGISDYTPLSVWLIRLGIGVAHGRPYHPQTQGKDERFHRTLQAEVLRNRSWDDLGQCQQAFDRWRDLYNLERPHQALNMAVPASRYRPSPRTFSRSLPPIEYGPDDVVRRVQGKGEIHYRGRIFHVGQGFHGYPVGLRPTTTDGIWEVYFCHKRIGQIDLREEN